MKNFTKIGFVFLAVLLVLSATASRAVPLTAEGDKTCATIQSGTIVASDGTPVSVGYDSWGYNYQAHLFNGLYCDAYRDAAWCQPYASDKLAMKWNDAWISNVDCDGDGLLDRHYGYVSYIGSGAWLTNHMSGEYTYEDKTCKWTYFVKIVAKPTADYVCNAIWGEFCTIQEVYNDPCGGVHGLQYLSPDHAGLGGW